MPVNGNISLNGNKTDELLIKPVAGDFQQFEIILANIVPNDTISKESKFVPAGTKIASPLGSGHCQDEYFHLAMRMKVKTEVKESCFYTNPSDYVDHVDLHPHWIQECKEFTFKHILQTVDAGGMGGGFEDVVKDLKKRAVEWLKTVNVKDVLNDLFPNSKFIKQLDGILDAFDGIIDGIKDIGLLFVSDGSNPFIDFESIMSTLAMLSKGVASLGNDFGNMLSAAGVPKEITDGFSQFAAIANGVADGLGVANDIYESLSGMHKDDEHKEKDIYHTISNIASFVGRAAGTIGDILEEAGVSDDVTDIFENMQMGTQGIDNVLGTIDEIRYIFDGDEMKALTKIGSNVGSVAGDVSSLLHDLGVSKDITDVLDKIENGIDGAMGLLDDISHLESNIATFSSDGGGVDGANKFISTFASDFADVAGDVGNFLGNIGVSADVTKVFFGIESGARSVSDVTTQIGSSMKHISDWGSLDMESVLNGVSNVGKTIKETVASVNKFLTGVGVTGDVTNILGRIEDSIESVTDMVDIVPSFVEDFEQIGKPNGVQDVVSAINQLASGVHHDINQMKDTLGKLGVSNDVLETLDKIEKTADGVSGLVATLGDTINAVQNASRDPNFHSVMDGVESIADGVQKGAGQLNTMLNNLGVSGDISDTLTKVQTISGGVSGIASSVDNFIEGFEHISKPESLSDVIDGASGIMKNVDHGAQDLKKALKSVGVSSKITGFLSEVQQFAGTATNITEEFHSTLSGLGIYGAKDFGDVLSMIGSAKGNLLNILKEVTPLNIKYFAQVLINVGPILESFQNVLEMVISSGPEKLRNVLEKQGQQGLQGLQKCLQELTDHGVEKFDTIISKYRSERTLHQLLIAIQPSLVKHLHNVIQMLDGTDIDAIVNVLNNFNNKSLKDVIQISNSLGSENIYRLGSVLMKLKDSSILNMVNFLQNVKGEDLAKNFGSVLSGLTATVGSFLNGSGLEDLDRVFSTFSGNGLVKLTQGVKSTFHALGINGIQNIGSVVGKLGKSVSAFGNLLSSVPKGIVNNIGEFFSRIDNSFDSLKTLLEKIENTGTNIIGQVLSLDKSSPIIKDLQLALSFIKSGTPFQQVLSNFTGNKDIHRLLSSLGMDGTKALQSVLHDVGEIGRSELGNILSTIEDKVPNALHSIMSVLGHKDIGDFANVLKGIHIDDIDKLKDTILMFSETGASSVAKFIENAKVNIKSVLSGNTLGELQNIFENVKGNWKNILEKSLLSFGVTGLAEIGSVFSGIGSHIDDFKELMSTLSGNIVNSVGHLLSQVSASASSLLETCLTLPQRMLVDFGNVIKGTSIQEKEYLTKFCSEITQLDVGNFSMLLDNIPVASVTRGILNALGQNGTLVLAKALQELNEEGMNSLGNILSKIGKSKVADLAHSVGRIGQSSLSKIGKMLRDIKHSSVDDLKELVSSIDSSILAEVGSVIQKGLTSFDESFILGNIVDGVNDLLSARNAFEMSDMASTINQVIKSMGIQTIKKLGEIVSELGSSSKVLSELLQTLPSESFSCMGKFIANTASVRKDLINVFEKFSNANLKGVAVVLESKIYLHTFVSVLDGISQNEFDSVINNLHSDLPVQMLLLNLGPDISISLHKVVKLADRSLVLEFGKVIEQIGSKGFGYLHTILQVFDEQSTKDFGFVLSKIKSSAAASLSKIMSTLGTAGSLQMWDILKNVNPDFGSLMSGMKSAGLDGMLSAYKDVSSVASHITQSLKGSPLRAFSDVT